MVIMLPSRMKIIRPEETGIVPAIENAADVISQGGVIAYPTETFYGIGARFDDVKALVKLYGIKRRTLTKALPLIIGEQGRLDLVASSAGETALKLAGRFWPGPLTLLLPAKQSLSDLITAKTGKIAVRVPGTSFALELARHMGTALTATSANISGLPPADSAEDVVKYFGEALDLIIDCGKTPGGRPSTIVDASGEKIRFVRAGAISIEEIFAAL